MWDIITETRITIISIDVGENMHTSLSIGTAILGSLPYAFNLVEAYTLTRSTGRKGHPLFLYGLYLLFSFLAYSLVSLALFPIVYRYHAATSQADMSALYSHLAMGVAFSKIFIFTCFILQRRAAEAFCLSAIVIIARNLTGTMTFFVHWLFQSIHPPLYGDFKLPFIVANVLTLLAYFPILYIVLTKYWPRRRPSATKFIPIFLVGFGALVFFCGRILHEPQNGSYPPGVIANGGLAAILAVYAVTIAFLVFLTLNFPGKTTARQAPPTSARHSDPLPDLPHAQNATCTPAASDATAEDYQPYKSAADSMFGKVLAACSHMIEGQGQEAAEILNKLETRRWSTAHTPITGSPVVDTLLRERSAYAVEFGIDLALHATVGKDEIARFNVFDIAALLTQLIDNALNACFAAPNIDWKVDVSLQSDADALIVEVRNPCPPGISVKEGEGLRLVHKIARKYAGSADIQVGRDVFARVTLRKR